MKINNPFFILLTALMLSTTFFAQTNTPAPEYLHVPGPVVFENKAYSLSWTAHPAADFYKQEYFVKVEKRHSPFFSAICLHIK